MHLQSRCCTVCSRAQLASTALLAATTPPSGWLADHHGLLQSMEFDVTVFDTAPTGHTLRLLNMPSTLDAAMTKVMALRDKFGGIMGAATSMLGGGAAGGLDPEAVFSKLDEIKREFPLAPASRA